MLIYKILNNNAVISHDDHENEIIVLGKGIAFKSSVYDEIDEERIEKIFALENRAQRTRLETLIREIPEDFLVFCEELITMAEKRLNKKLDSNLLIALTDHVYSSIKNYQGGIVIPNMLVDEIQTFYTQEYQIALDMVEWINAHFKVNLDRNEAGFLAFHVINAEGKATMNTTIDIVKGIQEVCDLVKTTYALELEPESMDYSRFIVHLKFFFSRVYAKEPAPQKSLTDDGLYQMLITKYADLNTFLNQIQTYTMNVKGYHLSDSDRMYLVIHLARIVYKD